MHERLTTQSYAFRSPFKTTSAKPLLVCFSHLRWDFVWQRPQHLLSRAVKHYDVLIIEEPIFKPGVTRAYGCERAAAGRDGRRSDAAGRSCRTKMSLPSSTI